MTNSQESVISIVRRIRNSTLEATSWVTLRNKVPNRIVVAKIHGRCQGSSAVRVWVDDSFEPTSTVIDNVRTILERIDLL